MSNFKRFAQTGSPYAVGGVTPDPAGGWVLWSEAETALRDALKSAQEPAGYEQGYNEAKVEFEHERTRTNQLLNELYHDRARLERVIEDAVALLQDCVECAAVNNLVDAHGEKIGDCSLFGSIQQFIDTHDA